MTKPTKSRHLHIGFGAFARAHTMVYLDEMNRQTDANWGAVVLRMNSGADGLADLRRNGHNYHCGETDDQGVVLRDINAVTGTLHPKTDGYPAIFDLFASPDLALVSLTITEKGYCLENGRLNANLAAVKHDLADLSAPQTAIGLLVAGLAARRAAGAGKLTVMSCDNLPDNGALCRAAVIEFARLYDTALAQWITENTAFPATMVDRIVPAMTQTSHDQLAAEIGEPDPNGIICEPFRQWVIQDNFATERPPLDRAGAQFVDEIIPYEDMKLRMLNGCHSFLACTGTLLGHGTIADTMTDADLRRATRQLMMHEQVPTLNMPDGVDLQAYSDQLFSRFANSTLNHGVAQVATDTSQKIPQRFFTPIQMHMVAGRNWDLSSLTIAAWIAVVANHPINDPLSKSLLSAVSGPADTHVDRMLEIGAVFPRDLAENPAFRDAISKTYDDINRLGARAALAQRIPA